MARKCMCCNKLFEGSNCPRCGLTVFDMSLEAEGEEAKAMEAALNRIISGHRQKFLGSYEIGVTCYYWKDENGKVVLDKTTRQSFGSASELVGKTAWLEQEFARIPDVEEQNVELSVSVENGDSYPLQLQIPVLKEKQLQMLGIELDEQLQIRALLKNQTSQTHSAWCALLRD